MKCSPSCIQQFEKPCQDGSRAEVTEGELLLSELPVPSWCKDKGTLGVHLTPARPLSAYRGKHSLCSCRLLRLQGAARLPDSGQQAVILGNVNAI